MNQIVMQHFHLNRITQPAPFGGLGGGFAPRQLRRQTAESCVTESRRGSDDASFALTLFLFELFALFQPVIGNST